MRVRSTYKFARRYWARRRPQLGADDGPGVHARRPWTTEPSLRLSCLKVRRQARPPAQERSTKALGWCQHHGERGHGGRAPGPSRRDRRRPPRRPSRSCQSSAAAASARPSSPSCARARRARRRGRSRGQPAGPRRRPGLGWGGVRPYKLQASINTYEINSAREPEKLWPVLLRAGRKMSTWA